jgi:hypothetical protein
MPGGMPAGRLIAAADVPAGTAYPQMDPRAARFQAFFASSGAGFDRGDLILMRTYGLGHGLFRYQFTGLRN